MSELREIIDSLKKAAEAATPGPWVATEDAVKVVSSESFQTSIVGTGGFGEAGWFNTEEDQQYIAKADPTTVLMLIDELECSMKLNDLTDDHISPAHWRSLWAELENAKMDKRQAEEERDELRKNSDRYKWFRTAGHESDAEFIIWNSGNEEDFDAQVDAEIEKEKQP